MKHVLPLITIIVVSVSLTAQATLLVYENFNGFTLGALNQQDGTDDIGFTGNWRGSSVNLSANNSNATVTAGALAGIPTNYPFGNQTGDHLSTINSPAFRQLSTTYDVNSNNTLYFSWLMRSLSASSPTGGGLSIFASGAELFQFGITSNFNFRINVINPTGGNTTQILAGNNTASANTTYFMVGRLSTAPGADTLSLNWFSGNASIPLSETWAISSSTLSLNATNGAINSIRLNSPATFTFAWDELRIGTTWASVAVPEPSIAGFLAAGVAGLMLRRRRRVPLRGHSK